MSATDPHIDPEELLVQYVTGDITVEEMRQVETWIAANADNRRQYEHFKQIWDASLALADEKAVDEDLAWARFKDRIADETIAARPSMRFLWLKIAAAVILTFGAMLVGKMLLKSGDDARFATISSTREKLNTTVIFHSFPAARVTTDTLSDGSTVTRNKNATINYPSSFDGKVREVELNGEAFFNVKHDAARPFIVNVNGVKITVLGTSFNVKIVGSNTEVVVESGKVSVQRQTQIATLVAGQKLLFTPLRCKIAPNTDNSYRSYFDAQTKLPQQYSAAPNSLKKDAVRRDSVR